METTTYSIYIQNSILNALPPGKLKNTLSFFHRNQDYFSYHPFEFSRLVAQLESEKERERFREIIWIYWSRCIIPYLKTRNNNIGEEKNFQENDLINKLSANPSSDQYASTKKSLNSTSKLKTNPKSTPTMKISNIKDENNPFRDLSLFESNSISVEAAQLRYLNEQTLHAQEASFQNIRSNRFWEAFQILKQQKELLSKDGHAKFLNLLLHLNSDETLLLERFYFSNDIG